jgi:hypothetical protein
MHAAELLGQLPSRRKARGDYTRRKARGDYTRRKARGDYTRRKARDQGLDTWRAIK